MLIVGLTACINRVVLAPSCANYLELIIFQVYPKFVYQIQSLGFYVEDLELFGKEFVWDEAIRVGFHFSTCSYLLLFHC